MLETPMREVQARKGGDQVFRPVEPEDGFRLVRAFLRIKSPEQRKEILRQAEALAGGELSQRM